MKRHAWIALALVLGLIVCGPRTAAAWETPEPDEGGALAWGEEPPSGDDDDTFDPPVKPEGDPDGGQTRNSVPGDDDPNAPTKPSLSLSGLLDSLLEKLSGWLK